MRSVAAWESIRYEIQSDGLSSSSSFSLLFALHEREKQAEA